MSEYCGNKFNSIPNFGAKMLKLKVVQKTKTGGSWDAPDEKIKKKNSKHLFFVR